MSCCSTPSEAAAPAACCAEATPPAEINASCRPAVLLLFTTATGWLVLASLLALIAAIKLHSGGFLAQCSWLTYGRIRPAAFHLLVYGFLAPAGFGSALWMLARLGRTKLMAPTAAIGGALVWNIGVLLSLLGILAGNSAGYEWLEMPATVAPAYFMGFLGIAISAGLTLAFRKERALYVSQWYLILAFLAFAWTFTTASGLLFCHPSRGAAQAVVHYWFMGNFFNLFLAPLALAVIFYFIPKVAEVPLHSRQLALSGFWFLVLVAGWSGVPAGARLPSWMPSLSVVAAVMLIVPALACGANWLMTLEDHCDKSNPNRPFRFLVFAGAAYVVGTLLSALLALPFVAPTAEFTHTMTGVTHLLVYGFAAMTFFGAMYFILPEVTGVELKKCCQKLHFICATAGILLGAVGLVVGGVMQGQKLAGPVNFMDSVKVTTPFIGLSTLGALLLLVGSLALVLNFVHIVRQRCAACCGCADKGGKCS